MQLYEIVSIGSLAISIVTLVWIGGFRFSAVIHEIKNLSVRVDKFEDNIQRRFEKVDVKFEKIDLRFEKLEDKFEQRFNKIDSKLEKMQNNLHELDLRVNTLEQRKPQV